MSTYDLDNIPDVIWFPNDGSSPKIYRGSPLEMVTAMGKSQGASPEEALTSLASDMNIDLPANQPLERQAANIIAVLLTLGIVKQMPSA